MERFTGYYKRHTQLWLFIFGFVFCVFFNADTISIVSKLTNNPASRLAIVEQATQYIHDHQANFSADSLAHGKKIQQDTLKNRDDGQQFLAEVDSLRKSIISTDLKQAQTTLGLGWSTEELDTLDFPGWVLKIIGILLTTLAIYLGAPFWFDILNKFVNLRSAGKKPSEKGAITDALKA